MKRIFNLFSKYPVLATALLISSLSASAATVEVEMFKMKFIPAEITINKGDTIVWVNKEKRQYHSVWFEQLSESEPEDYFWPDETYQRQFNTTGSFPYRCGPHSKMTGIVHVK